MKDFTGNYRDITKTIRQIQNQTNQFSALTESARVASQSYCQIMPELYKSRLASANIMAAFNQQKEWQNQLISNYKLLEDETDLKRYLGISSDWTNQLTQITKQMNTVGLLQKRKFLSMRIVEPIRVYNIFTEKTTKAIEETVNPYTKLALKTSISISQMQMVNWTKLLMPVLTIPHGKTRPNQPRGLQLLDTMQNEILAAEHIPNIEDENELFATTPSMHASSMALQVLRNATLCNQILSTDSKTEIFKHTNNLQVVYTEFSFIIATDIKNFKEFIDCLYKLLYEAAGKDKLRYIKEHGGVLEREECNIIWNIKTLRNKWLQHDPDHGDARSIKRNHEQLANSLKELGANGLPVTTKDYRMLQTRILSEVNIFLDQIISRLKEVE